jgi:septin family protein
MDRLQLINEKKEFSEQLTEYTTDKWQISQLGFDYNVIAVFGSQSTGKSTLLNRLFETEFDVMDTANRKRTTKGSFHSSVEV